MKNCKENISNMTKLERYVLCMVIAEKMTFEETAMILQVPYATIEKIYFDVTERLLK